MLVQFAYLLVVGAVVVVPVQFRELHPLAVVLGIHALACLVCVQLGGKHPDAFWTQTLTRKKQGRVQERLTLANVSQNNTWLPMNKQLHCLSNLNIVCCSHSNKAADFLHLCSYFTHIGSHLTKLGAILLQLYKWVFLKEGVIELRRLGTLDLWQKMFS